MHMKPFCNKLVKAKRETKREIQTEKQTKNI